MQFLLPLLFVLATYGFCVFAVDALKLMRSHALPFVFIFYALVVFAAGFAGLLLAASLLLLIVGAGLFIYYCIQKNKRKLLWFDPVWMGLFLLLSIFAVYHLYGQKLTHYDNFSHWANIVQVMLDTGRFPIESDVLVSFTSYPPGSASFLYLIGIVFGNHEDVLMIGQAILIISLTLALYQKTGQQRYILLVVLTSFVVFTFFYNSTINNLLVDSLLPCVGGFAFILLYSYLEQPRKIWLTVIPVLSFAFFVKSSGLYYVVVAFIVFSASLRRRFGARKLGKKKLLWMIVALVALTVVFGAFSLLLARGHGYSVPQLLELISPKLPLFAALPLVIALCIVTFDALVLAPRVPKQERIALIAILAVPAILFALWMLHVRLVFHGTASKHAMSIFNYFPTLMHKSLSDMANIAVAYVKALLLVKYVFWSVLFLLIGVFSFVFQKWLKPEVTGMLRMVCFSFYGYLVMLYVMYVVSMPNTEALTVAGFGRYFKTIVLFCLYLLTFLAFRISEPEVQPARSKRITKNVSFVIAMLVSFGMIALVSDRCFTRYDYSSSERYYLETLIKQYQIKNNESYLFVLSGENNYYMQYLGLYTFRTEQIDSITKEEIFEFPDWNNYRYVICLHLSDEYKAQVYSMLDDSEADHPLPDVFVQN